MTIMSNMQIRLKPDVRDEAVDAFMKRRVFEECAQAIPGFLWAKLLEDQNEPDAISVIAEWTDKTSFEAWVAHPVRALQEADLAHYLEEQPETSLYRCKSTYELSR